mmetsp:Transcript_5216/g.6161  ORF Transcript_5216/g.6161 Transcript_5216/m.6161 type:complete len:408 (+) Transcript_5216:68-1291(+)
MQTDKRMMHSQQNDHTHNIDMNIDQHNIKPVALSESKMAAQNYKMQGQLMTSRTLDYYGDFLPREHNEGKSLPNRNPLMFSEGDGNNKFPKEELKEEVEEEKDLAQHESSSSSEDRNSNSNEEEMIGQNEEQDNEIDMAIDDRVPSNPLNTERNNRENSFQNRAEVQSIVENLSNTIPNLQITNEYQQNNNVTNERRIFNQFIGHGSIDSSDYEEGDGGRLNSSNSLEEQIESIMANFISTISLERQQISEVKKEFKMHKLEFEKRKKQEWERIHMEKEICKENKKRIKKLLKDSEDIIDLDIGGTHHVTTTRATLCRFKNSTLASMFSGRHALRYNKERVFMDRDGEPFCKLISYLRSGKLPIINDKHQEYLFKEEMNYWQIPFDIGEEEEKISDLLIPPTFDPDW